MLVVVGAPEAEQELILTDGALIEGEGRSELMKGYFGWLDEIHGLYVDHLTENIDEYPQLNRKFGVLKGTDALREMLAQVVLRPVKYKRDEQGVDLRDQPFLPYRQRMYFRESATGGKQVRCALDGEMLERGLVRKHVPIFDRNGVEAWNVAPEAKTSRVVI